MGYSFTREDIRLTRWLTRLLEWPPLLHVWRNSDARLCEEEHQYSPDEVSVCPYLSEGRTDSPRRARWTGLGCHVDERGWRTSLLAALQWVRPTRILPIRQHPALKGLPLPRSQPKPPPAPRPPREPPPLPTPPVGPAASATKANSEPSATRAGVPVAPPSHPVARARSPLPPRRGWDGLPRLCRGGRSRHEAAHPVPEAGKGPAAYVVPRLTLSSDRPSSPAQPVGVLR